MSLVEMYQWLSCACFFGKMYFIETGKSSHGRHVDSANSKVDLFGASLKEDLETWGRTIDGRVVEG